MFALFLRRRRKVAYSTSRNAYGGGYKALASSHSTTTKPARLVPEFLRSCAALALIPLSRIDGGWLEIQSESPEHDHPAFAALERFMECSISTWLENEAIFLRELWNHYANVGPRTTNHLEGWHRSLYYSVRRAHVNIYEMVGYLQNLKAKYKNEMRMLRMGHGPPRQGREYEILNQRLMGSVHDHETGILPRIDYIHNVAYSIKF